MFRKILMGLALVELALIGLASTASADQLKENKALFRQFCDEVINKGNLDVIDKLMAEDFQEHESLPGLNPSREGVKQFFIQMHTAFPDLKTDIQFMLAEGDKVAAYMVMSGTQKGDFMGMPATGKKMNVNVVDIVRISDEEIVEHWGVTDGMTMMQQLGVTE